MIKKIFLFLFLIQVFLNTTAKTDEFAEIPPEKVNLTGKLYMHPVGLDGSPYLIEDWIDTDLFLENGQVAKNIKTKLNLIDNDLIFYNDGLLRVFTIDKETINKFKYKVGNSDSTLFIKYTGKELGYRLKSNQFVEVAYDNRIRLIIKHFAEVISPNDLSSKKKVYSKKSYFLIINDTPQEIKLRYRYIYKIFPEKKKEIRKLIKENKLRKQNISNFNKLLRIIEDTPDIMNSVRLEKQ